MREDAPRIAADRSGLFVLASGSAALAEPPTQPIDDITEQVDATRDKTADPDKNSLLIVPIPQSSPTLGTGLTLGAGYFYNPNGSKEPWITAVGAMATSNGSRALGALQKMTLADDSIRITAFAGWTHVEVQQVLVITFDTHRVRLRHIGIAQRVEGASAAALGLDGKAVAVPEPGPRSVRLYQPPRQALVVPEIAVIQVGTEAFVYRVADDSTASRAKVTLGARRRGEVEVTSGIGPGDTIVVEGAVKLRDGARVTPTPEAAAGA